MDVGLDFDWYQIQIDFKLTFLIQICLQNAHCCFEIDNITSGFNLKIQKRLKEIKNRS